MCRAILILALSALSARAGLSKLEAISMLETGNNDSAVGGAGEVSRYQIMPRTWRRFTSSQAYSDKQLSAWVADQYLAQLETAFCQRAGREPSDFDRYVLWNAGPSYYERIGFAAARVNPVIAERADQSPPDARAAECRFRTQRRAVGATEGSAAGQLSRGSLRRCSGRAAFPFCSRDPSPTASRAEEQFFPETCALFGRR